MDDKLTAALIGALSSSAVGLIAYVTTWRSIRAKEVEMARLVSEKYMERLYDLRISEYPKLLEILGRIEATLQREESRTFQLETVSGILMLLSAWRLSKGGLSLSEESMLHFLELEKSLKLWGEETDVAKQNNGSDVMAETQKLRAELRRDVHVLHDSDRTRVSIHSRRAG